MNKRGGILRKALVALILAGGAWVAYRHGGADFSLKRYGGELEQDVNEILSRQRVTDSDIVSQVRVEHTRWGQTWVETRRSIRVVSERRQDEIAEDLAAAAKRHFCFFDKVMEREGMRLTLKWGPVVFQNLQLTLRGGGAPGPSHAEPRTSRVAIVVDDVAYETVSMDHFASLGIPLTFAILPREKHSKELSAKARQLGYAVMLHLPMEPKDLVHNDPGPSALLLNMSDQELHHHFDQDVASVPGIVGINNHMGSAFTESEPKLSLVLRWIKDRKLYFLDSHTSGKSVAPKVARKLGLPYLINETFLDNEDQQKAIEHQLDLVMALAEKRGQTIAIGHYRRKWLVQALSAKIPEFHARGIEFVTVPHLLTK